MLHTPWPQSFYSRILAPNRKELVSFIKDENAILHPDQEFSWGNDCLMEKKQRLGPFGISISVAKTYVCPDPEFPAESFGFRFFPQWSGHKFHAS